MATQYQKQSEQEIVNSLNNVTATCDSLEGQNLWQHSTVKEAILRLAGCVGLRNILLYAMQINNEQEIK